MVTGATDDGKVVGQDVSDKTRREIARMLDSFEPPAPVDVEFVDLPDRSKKVIVLEAKPPGEARPFTFDGRAYQRVQTTTSGGARNRARGAPSPSIPNPRLT